MWALRDELHITSPAQAVMKKHVLTESEPQYFKWQIIKGQVTAYGCYPHFASALAADATEHIGMRSPHTLSKYADPTLLLVLNGPLNRVHIYSPTLYNSLRDHVACLELYFSVRFTSFFGPVWYAVKVRLMFPHSLSLPHSRMLSL